MPVLEKLKKGTVSAAVAGSLAVSMGLGAAAPANAFLPLLAAPLLIGGTSLTLGATLGTTSFITAVGWGLAGTAVVGVGAYATQDWWVPIVQGAFGGAEPPPPAGEDGSQANTSGSSISVATGSTNSYQINSGWQSHLADPEGNIHPAKLGFTATQRLNGFDATFTYGGNDYQAGSLFGYGYNIKCKRPDGTIYQEKKLIGTSFGNGTYSAYPRTRTISGFCQQSTHAALGIVVGPPKGDAALRPSASGSEYPGTVNKQMWGESIEPIEDKAAFDVNSEDVKYKTTVECVKPDGSLFSITADSTGADGKAVKFPACDAVSPGSHSTMNQKVEAMTPQTGGKYDPLWSMQSPAADPNMPLCDVRRPGAGCMLVVKKDGQLCTIGNWECANWTSLARDPNWTERLSCQYGPYAVPLNTCNPLERAYETGGTVATEPNIDGNPDTRADTDPNGETVPKPNTGTGATTGTAPRPGGSEVPGGAATPAPSGTESAGCFPGGWAVFNPMWIVDGIKCSFIPKTDIKARVETLQDTASTKAPLTWFSPNITGPGGGGCPAWVVSVGGAFSQNVVCGQGFTNAILGIRGPLFGLLSAAMVWPLVRSLWYAAIPVMRVTPSSGGKD